ncbi:MAG: acylphosphatase [Mesorhizobium sp.]|uniref:acylphosphatase n=1 Tax=unclassified Mesorhizobium TaxID=325217 RepID=UPI000F74F467|nr:MULTISPECIES: acylphosphatase [unclassified Mesorhizobium]AZO48272.1 acylphosphatase [Mesorhizobium sp. M4B.F.Ca.ET.058.02.1.1]RVC45662.1 acylphosphatase [Mesorhizobium sp. M4A.F.Ca.ET.090.04.2.1]RVC83003.1 acylphosphatase [Mesorhizobium sp. M4A.F.Ca.ET.022.05.2.1]RWC55553.1 MAG: acylphosphatase [Mesorhizobium sp.]RWD04226.1 MAG: acylphosphatase [Mesorhizobium sp.]
MANQQRAVRASVHGRVQGVSYRVWTRSEAVRLGLTGWVRNESDGTVTAMLAGTDAAVSTMIDRLWQGPRGAVVLTVEIEQMEPHSPPVDFRIIA